MVNSLGNVMEWSDACYTKFATTPFPGFQAAGFRSAAMEVVNSEVIYV